MGAANPASLRSLATRNPSVYRALVQFDHQHHLRIYKIPVPHVPMERKFSSAEVVSQSEYLVLEIVGQASLPVEAARSWLRATPSMSCGGASERCSRIIDRQGRLSHYS